MIGFGVSTKQRLPGPHFIRCGPQEDNSPRNSSMMISFFMLTVYAHLHVLQLFQIISLVGETRYFVLTA